MGPRRFDVTFLSWDRGHAAALHAHWRKRTLGRTGAVASPPVGKLIEEDYHLHQDGWRKGDEPKCGSWSSARSRKSPKAIGGSYRMKGSRSGCSTGRGISTLTRISACIKAGLAAKASSGTRS